MGDKSEAIQARHVDALLLQMRLQCCAFGFGLVYQIDKQDIGLRCFNLKTRNASQALCQMRHQLVILSKARDMVVKRIRCSSSHEASLPQTAARHFSQAIRFGNELFRATQSRAHGRTQAFAKANRNTVKTLRDVFNFVVG